MNKNELVAELAQKANITKSSASKTLETLLSIIQNKLQEGEEVRLVNFGTFLVAKRRASEGRNPRTGAPIRIAACKQPKFRPGKALKASVN